MRLPKKVDICGKTYSVSKDNKNFNSGGSTHKQEITVGTRGNQSDERQFDGFVHETVELVTCEKRYRYGDGHSESSVFVMNHKEFEQFASALATAIYPMVRER